MTGNDFAALLRQTFIEELEEHVQTLNQGLLVLEKGVGEGIGGVAGNVDGMFRAAHSLKGAARAVEVDEVADACHSMETLFHAVRRGDGVLDGEIFSLLFAVVDGIAAAGRDLQEGGSGHSETLVELNLSLADAVSSYAPAGVDAELAARAEPSDLPHAPDAPAEELAAGRARESGASIRVRAHKLDNLLDLSGELLVARQRIKRRRSDMLEIQNRLRAWQREWRAAEARTLRQAAGKGQGAEPTRNLDKSNRADLRALTHLFDRLMVDMREDWRGLDRVAEPLEEVARDIRMVPFEAACTGLERAVRDAAKVSGKQAELVVIGGEIEVDRSIVEILRDPLMHMVRNAVAHGFESDDERQAAGKPALGKVAVQARVVGAQLEVTVEDDGRGLDIGALRAKASAMGLAAPPDDRDLPRLLLEPGFSTASEVTTVSGRGVGLDVVRTAVGNARGSIDISAVPGRGTRFAMRLPLTLTRLRALLFFAGGQVFALDIDAVHRTLRIGLGELEARDGRDTIMLDGEAIPVVDLAEAIGLERIGEAQARDILHAIFVQIGRDKVVVTVDRLLAEDEIVVKDIGDRLSHGYGISGASILPTGEVALILSVSDLVQAARSRAPARRLAEVQVASGLVRRKRLIVCDDSITTRTLEVGILEGAGYEVAAAADGDEAWRILQEQGADLVVSDVDMPRMNGFVLTETIRASIRFRDLPVVLVTSLSTDDHRRRGMTAGANAYLSKSGFDQGALLEAVEQLIRTTP